MNEVLVGVGKKDRWNASAPANEAAFKGDATTPGELYPILATYMNVLFGIQVPPGAARRSRARALPRPAGQRRGAPRRLSDPADRRGLLRPAAAEHGRSAATPFASASRLGYLGGDPAGFPNGRRMCDDVVDIELRVVAGIILGVLPHDRRRRPEVRAGSRTASSATASTSPSAAAGTSSPSPGPPTSAFAAVHAGPATPTHTPQVRAIKDPSVKGFPEGISDEEYAERVRIARDREDLARIQATKDAR